MVEIAPSLLSADFSNLKGELKKLEKAGVRRLHLDVMDGHFVPNLTFGPALIHSIRSITQMVFDTHLMMTNPLAFIGAFAEAGSDSITVHIESSDDIAKVISEIKKYHAKVGISLRPKTPISKIIPFLPLIDSVLIMSVEPGFGGQAFQKEALKRIAELKDLIGKKTVKIAVDGGINPITAPACRLAGADILVAGSYIFKQKNYALAVERLKHD